MSLVLKAPYAEADRQHIVDELARVTGSPAFLRSPSSQRLLNFLVQQELAGEAESLKESYVGHVHYGRAANYDTKNDALVRVNVKRLRVLLEACYAESNASTVQIDIPRGSYVPRYLRVQQAAAHADTVRGAVYTDDVTKAESEQFTHLALATAPVQAATAQLLHDPELRNRSVPHSSLARLRPHLLLGIALVALLLSVAISFAPGNKPQAAAVQAGWIARPFLRSAGLATFPDYSPDGMKVAFTLSQDPAHDHSDVFIEDLRSQSLNRLDTGTASSARPVWSPSGTQIAYLSTRDFRTEVDVYSFKTRSHRTVQLLKGTFPWLCQLPRLSWTRDEKHIVTADSTTPSAPCRIVSIDISTGVEQVLSGGLDGVIGDVEPAVSPDGRRIAFLRNTGTLVGDLYVMNGDGSGLHRETWDNRDILGFCWSAAEEKFILASRRTDGTLRLWASAAHSGGMTRLTDGVTTVGFPALNPDGKTILFTSYRSGSSIWRIWPGDRTPQQLIASDSFNADAKTSPDGRTIAFRSDRSGSNEIWLSDAQGQHVRQLTALSGPAVSHITWSPDGKQLAFECRDGGHTDVCLMAASGGPINHPVPWSSNQEQPVFAPDGEHLYFSSKRSGSDEVYRLTLGQAEPELVAGSGAVRVAEAWRAPFLLVARFAPDEGMYAQARGKSDLACSQCEPGHLLLHMDQEHLRNGWDVAPGGFWFVGDSSKDGKTAIYRYTLADRATTLFTTVGHKLLMGDSVLAVEPNGKSALIVEPGQETADIYMLERGK